jgi:hypothetical protein
MIFRHSRSKEPIFYTYEVCTKKADTIVHIFKLQSIEIYVKKLYYKATGNANIGNFLLSCDCFLDNEIDMEAVDNTISLLRSITRKEIDKLAFALSKNYDKKTVKEYKEYYYDKLGFDPSEDMITKHKEDGTIEYIALEHKYDLYVEPPVE